MFYANARAGLQPPQCVPYDNSKMSRVGSIDPSNKTKFICYSCYERGHTAPQCQLKMTQLDNVVKNYDALNDEERKTVPDTAYRNAKQYLAIPEANAKKDKEEKNDSKN